MSAIGSIAPDFSLPDRDGTVRSLAQYRGAPVVLVFFPYAFSPICTDELCHLQDHADMFDEYHAAVVCISTDSHYALDAFARQESYDFQMLSDHWPHGDVARRYGVLDESEGCAHRHTLTIDAQGIIRDISSADITRTREWDRLRDVLESLSRS